MSDPLNLVALASKIDEPLFPPLEQVVIFVKILGYICDLKPQRLPERRFQRLPCPSSDTEDVDEGIWSQGIDFLGRYEYEPNEITVKLHICRIMRFCGRHGFHREDVIKIVLIHELAHFVTHLGTKESAYWEGFCRAEAEEREDFAQEATHLLLRVAGYDHLVNVFDALSQLCPAKYNTWRQSWKQHLKKKDKFDIVLQEFRGRNLQFRKVPERSCIHDCTGYDE
jgi:hypothetical protein